jgi:hypothetical protein
MPEGVGYGTSVDEMFRTATDPLYEGSQTPEDIGVLSAGLPGGPLRPSYEQGGVVDAGGPQAGLAPPGQIPQQGGTGAAQVGREIQRSAAGKIGQQPSVTPAALEAEMQRMAREHPDQVNQARDAVMKALNTGQLTEQELNMGVQLATAASNNPQIWPQLRKFAIEQGMADEGEISPEYDEGVVLSILMAARSIQNSGGAPQQGVPQSAGQVPVAQFMRGGPLPANSKNPDGSIPIDAHKGEFVIPENVVRAKGTDFFEKMIEGSSAKKSA